uniref:Uncharacterized protein n=1 Tax=Opuntia streptacantha TaxID=393608 RepID=A0A7C9EL95_OPUST
MILRQSEHFTTPPSPFPVEVAAMSSRTWPASFNMEARLITSSSNSKFVDDDSPCSSATPFFGVPLTEARGAPMAEVLGKEREEEEEGSRFLRKKRKKRFLWV